MNNGVILFDNERCAVIENNGKARLVSKKQTDDGFNNIFFLENDIEELENKVDTISENISKSRNAIYKDNMNRSFGVYIGILLLIIVFRFGMPFTEFLSYVFYGALACVGLGGSLCLIDYLIGLYEKKKGQKEIAKLNDKIKTLSKQLEEMKSKNNVKEIVISNQTMTNKAVSKIEEVLKSNEADRKAYEINNLKLLRQLIDEHYTKEGLKQEKGHPYILR